jgi:tRNA threonylcarbamoyladenosine biosynthesis protein TsaE
MNFLLSDLASTRSFGLELARQICVQEHAIVALRGTLGAGKTTLVKSVAEGLGVTEVVNSPTFTMFNEYHSGRLSLFHLDLYRGGETGEKIDLSMLALEMDEFIHEPSVVMIEWPQYFTVGERNYLDDLDYLEIRLDFAKAEDCRFGFDLPDGCQGEGPALKVLRECYDPKNLIKDGAEEPRIATLVGHGPESNLLIERLRDQLAAMVIYL